VKVKNKRFKIINLGCRVNQFESNLMHDLLVKNGAINSTTSNDADLIVINTCSVTNKADKKSLYFIRQSLKQPKHPVVIVTGCFSQ
jgi:threonylcarbamoyladenosine tRNA methylthiotransferase MtaB